MRARARKIFRGGIGAVVVAVVAAVIFVKATPFGGRGVTRVVDRATAAGVLLLNNSAEPVSLDPQVVTGAADMRIARALFEGLLVNDPISLEPRPAAAVRYEVSDSGLEYTFHLRAGLRWSDGERITSADFLFAWQRVLSPRFASPNASMFFVVKNARAFYEGRLRAFSDTGFSAPDAQTIRIKVEHPCATLPLLLCHPAWAPVPRHVILRYGVADAPGTAWTRPGRIAGNGAFRLKTWKVADRIEVERNPFYWNDAATRLNGVKFFAITDALAEERAFRGGLLHITSTVPPMKVATLRAAGDAALRLDPFFSTTFIRVNTRIPPLNDVRVRRALSLALRRSEITEHVMRAGEVPAFCLTPDGVSGYTCAAHLAEDVAEARRLLAEAGYPNGAGFPVLNYLYNDHETSRLIAQALQEMWASKLGIRVELSSREWKVYKRAVESGEYQLARSAWSGDYPDPASFLELFTAHSEQNQTGWQDAAFDKAVGAALRAPLPAARLAHFQEAEARLLDRLPVIPIAHNRNKFLIRAEVRGWHPNVLDIQSLTAVWLEKEQPCPSASPVAKAAR
ncbi:MAG: peptide ABC transporter substrate-binding protein [Puniceicoccales bacterium]|jgi:oligopeptide transport system substrate-binding protein|nr:peptide ABC transporter substrate-binding protein [Puniceicoccales bacterium]